jgi:hypothetical protein
MPGRHSCSRGSLWPKLPGARHINRGQTAPVRVRATRVMFEADSSEQAGEISGTCAEQGIRERSYCPVKSTSIRWRHRGIVRSHDF